MKGVKVIKGLSIGYQTYSDATIHAAKRWVQHAGRRVSIAARDRYPHDPARQQRANRWFYDKIYHGEKRYWRMVKPALEKLLK